MDRNDGWLVRVLVGVLILTVAVATTLAPGCGQGSAVHSALTITDPKDIEEATKRGIGIINKCGDPYAVYQRTTKEINQRVGSDVIVRTAAICLPKEELAFQVAMAGDPSEEGAKRAANAVIRQINRQVKFTVVLQMDTSHKPEDIGFKLTTNLPKPYPPVAVEPPEFIQEVNSVLDPSMPSMAIYGYNVSFPTAGSPGFPAIDGSVGTLNLVIESGGTSAKIPFNLPSLAVAR